MFGFKNTSEKKSLKIIIVGAGKVGATLVERLSKEGNDITVIDRDARKVQQLASYYDVMGLAGNGASLQILEEADAAHADLFIAVTASDELNLLCCTMAKMAGDCAAIARVRTPDYSDDAAKLRDKLGLAMLINPEMEAAKEISRVLALPAALEITTFAHGQADLMKFRIPADSTLAGMSISDFGKRGNENILVCGIQRGGEVTIPYGDFVFQAGDMVSFVASPRGARDFLKKMGLYENSAKTCMIVGGGRSAYYLASQLLKNNVKVKVIERDLERCNELSTLLPNVIVINGDGTDIELLKEEGIEYTEAFVPLTGIDEENILLTLQAKKLSNAKVITKLSRNTFTDVVSDLQLDSVIYPRYIATEAIISYARAKNASRDSSIETMTHLFDNKVEAIEFNIENAGEIAGLEIRDLHVKREVIICFINRNGNIIYPKGSDHIESGDTVMIATTETGFTSIMDIFDQR